MIIINKRIISQNHPPYIIAELSANHNGSLLEAKNSIKIAKENGADAVKIQTYTPDTMTIDSDRKGFVIEGGIWDGYKLYDLYKEAHTPYSWHPELFTYAKEIGITIFSTPFDETAVDLLDDLGTPAYKIASFELCDIPLIKYVASKKKPILMSTGMASFDEIKDAVGAARNNGCENILLFHCISSYPAPLEESNLLTIDFLRKTFELEVGLSDHTLGNTASIASIAVGASAIEKHFIIDRNNKGPDSSFSIEPHELKDLKEKTNQTWLALGSSNMQRAECEKESLKFRRSIYFVNNLKKGDIIGKKDIKRIRPGYGLPPKFEDYIIGKILKLDVNIGDPVQWIHFE